MNISEISKICCFNSTTVRLKVIPKAINPGVSFTFQFYDSTIKSEAYDYIDNEDYSFNSTTVRLKAFAAQHRVEITTGFNSTTVRLKELDSINSQR